MRKKLKFFAFLAVAAASAAMLTGFRSEHYLGLDGETGSVDLGAISYNGSTEAETFLTGLDGKNIKASEIKYLKDKNYRPTNILDENDFGCAECIGFAYAFKPGVYFDEIRDPEKFDENRYIGEEAEPSTEYFRVNAGDKFGSLTVRSAKCSIGTAEINGEKYLGYLDGEIEFDGEITLTGLLNIQTRLGEAYGDYEREMLFFAEPENGIPLSLEYFYDPGHRSEIYHDANNWDKVYTDSPRLDIGKLSDYPGLDFGGLTYGDTARVEITVTGLRLVGQLMGNSCFAYAKPVDVRQLTMDN